MCGIIGIISRTGAAAPLLIDGLKRLAYRGYDSAGVATLVNGHIERRRAEGKIANLERVLAREPLGGAIGIGHTRWATHGQPNTVNAHPHADDRVVLVHNGIIENFQDLRRELTEAGCDFATDTDTEAVVHLVSHHLSRGMTPPEAVAEALRRIEGAFALAILFAGHDDLMIGARRGSPLAIGYGNGEMYLGSDALALAPLTPPSLLSRGRRLGRGPARRCGDPRPQRHHRRARDQADRNVRCHDRQGQLPPFHAQGDL